MFRLLSSERVYRGRAFDVRRDEVSLPNGQTTRLDIVDHVGSVALVPLDGEQRIWFVRQFRHAAQKVLLELPAGTLEKGEAPAEGAQREVREEIGMAAGKLQKIGEFYLAPGYSTEFMHIFLATDLQADPLPGDADEFLSIQAIPLAQLDALVADGQIQDAKSLAALLLARPYLTR